MEVKQIIASIRGDLFLYLSILLILSGTGEVMFSQNLEGKIKLELSTDTSIFVWGEHIWLDVTIVNLLNEQVPVPDPASHVRISVADDRGKTLAPGSIILVIERTYVPLPPKSRVTESFSVEHWNDKTEDSPGARLLPATYSVSAVLKDIASNILNFRVIPPSAEDRIVAQEIVNKLRKFQPRAQEIQDAKELLRRYPGTVYLPNIYRKLFVHLSGSDRPAERADELIKYSLEFIEKFPNKGEGEVGLSYFVMGFRNKLGINHNQSPTVQQWRAIEGELQKLKSSFPNERMRRYIEKTIKNNKVQ